MLISTKIVKAAPVALAVAAASLIFTDTASALSWDDGVTTVGREYKREPKVMGCHLTCRFDAHFPLTTCNKRASERLRFDRLLLPDTTVRSYSNYTSCTNYYWDNFRSVDSHSHHQDAKVATGSGKVHFFYTDIRP